MDILVFAVSKSFFFKFFCNVMAPKDEKCNFTFVATKPTIPKLHKFAIIASTITWCVSMHNVSCRRI